MDVDSDFEKEKIAALERIRGASPPTGEVKKTTKTHRYEQFLKSKLKKTKDDLEPGNPANSAKDSKSEDEEKKAEASSNQSFAEQIEEVYGATPDEAWPTPLNRKFQTYARRVVQFSVLNLSGSGLGEYLAELRKEDVQTILAKYKSLLSGAGWTSYFLPAAFLELAYRVEINPDLMSSNEMQEQFETMGKSMHKDNPVIAQVLDETLNYARMRELPITIFGTSSSGSFVDQKSRSPADVLTD